METRSNMKYIYQENKIFSFYGKVFVERFKSLTCSNCKMDITITPSVVDFGFNDIVNRLSQDKINYIKNIRLGCGYIRYNLNGMLADRFCIECGTVRVNKLHPKDIKSLEVSDSILKSLNEDSPNHSNSESSNNNGNSNNNSNNNSNGSSNSCRDPEMSPDQNSDKFSLKPFPKIVEKKPVRKATPGPPKRKLASNLPPYLSPYLSPTQPMESLSSHSSAKKQKITSSILNRSLSSVSESFPDDDEIIKSDEEYESLLEKTPTH